MRLLVLISVAALAVASVAAAQPSSAPHSSEPAATLCLDTLGGSHPPVCHSMSASRLASPPDICLCHGPYMQVRAPYCAPGEKPPAESAAMEHARAKAAKDGSLFGDSYEGRRMCVVLKDNGGG